MERKGGGLLSYGHVRRSFPRYLKHYQVPGKKKNDNLNGTMRKYMYDRSGFDYQGRHKTKEAALTTAVDDKGALNKKQYIDLYKGILFKMYMIKEQVPSSGWG